MATSKLNLRRLRTTLDNTPPTVSILSPQAEKILSNLYESGSTAVVIAGTALDVRLATWTLSYGSGTNPTTFFPIASGTSSVTNAQLGTWATSTLANGPYVLKLEATDSVGNRGTAQILVTLANFKVAQTTTHASGLQLNTAAGSTETATYTSTVPLAVTQTLVIKNEAGTIVRTLVNGPRSPGVFADVWNGRDDANAPLPDGGYFYVATFSAGGSVLTWDLTGQYIGGSLVHSNSLQFSEYDPFNNKPLRFTYSYPNAGRTSLGAGAATPSCTPPNVCIFLRKYEEAGSHTVSWAGVDQEGVFRPEVRNVGVLNGQAEFSKNAVVLYGTKPTVTGVRVDPPVLGPILGTQTVSFDFTTYQAQAADVSIEYLNQGSKSILRTILLPGRTPGHVTAVWDGRADNGMLVAPGPYTVTVKVRDVIGNVVNGQILTQIQY